MSNDEEQIEKTEDAGPTGEGVTNEPRGNPDVDQEALDKGLEQLDRVKPY
jgi:hypothetical protein